MALNNFEIQIIKFDILLIILMISSYKDYNEITLAI